MSNITRIRIDIPEGLTPTQAEILQGSIEGFLATYGTGDHDDHLGRCVARAKVEVRDMATEEQIEAARDEWQNGDVQVDDDAEVSLLSTPDGADFGWVQAWVRVDSMPMPVTYERIKWLLENEDSIDIPNSLDFETAAQTGLDAIEANWCKGYMMSPSDLIDALSEVDWEGD